MQPSTLLDSCLGHSQRHRRYLCLVPLVTLCSERKNISPSLVASMHLISERSGHSGATDAVVLSCSLSAVCEKAVAERLRDCSEFPSSGCHLNDFNLTTVRNHNFSRTLRRTPCSCFLLCTEAQLFEELRMFVGASPASFDAILLFSDPHPQK